MSGNIHYWGVKEEVFKALFDKSSITYKKNDGYTGNSVYIGMIRLENYAGDCGVVTMHNISSAGKHDFEGAIKYCSLSGYSVLIGTLVGYNVAQQKKVMEDLDFVAVSSGKSNRNNSKYHHMMVLRIPDSQMEKKGY
jgi:hypothetical protein